MTDPDYVVQYGRSAFVGRFTAAPGLQLTRGERAVVRSPRGLEIGEILCLGDGRFAGQLDPAAGGELLRRVTPEDEATAAEQEAAGLRLLLDASRFAEDHGWPLAFLDVEVLLDGSAAVLHTLPWELCDADALFAELSARHGMPVRMLDLSRTPAVKDPPTGCGKPDCGSGSGGCSSCGSGCSTGSCSRGQVKSAEELTAYFAQLRQKMEQSAGRTPLY